ncbi:hypothetical protein [Gilvibacter sp.]|uniref:hypothetical protein n=1 Tax=Gilvibacter sp. TaxID=2729997 RepID=UPI003F4A6B44
MKIQLKRICTGLAVFFLLMTSGLIAQNNLTASQWQEDLDFLQKTVHQDYPFLFKKSHCPKMGWGSG